MCVCACYGQDLLPNNTLRQRSLNVQQTNQSNEESSFLDVMIVQGGF